MRSKRRLKKEVCIFLVFSILAICSFIFCMDLSSKEISHIKSTGTYKRLISEIDKIRVVDDHEHLPPEKIRVEEVPDFFDIIMEDYTGADIRNIGNTFSHDEKFLDKSLSIEERWTSFLPVYKRIKNTGYMRCLRLGIKKVHGIGIQDADSIKKINASIKKLYKSGIYRKVLHDLGKLDYVLVYRHSDHPDEDVLLASQFSKLWRKTFPGLASVCSLSL